MRRCWPQTSPLARNTRFEALQRHPFRSGMALFPGAIAASTVTGGFTSAVIHLNRFSTIYLSSFLISAFVFHTFAAFGRPPLPPPPKKNAKICSFTCLLSGFVFRFCIFSRLYGLFPLAGDFHSSRGTRYSRRPHATWGSADLRYEVLGRKAMAIPGERERNYTERAREYTQHRNRIYRNGTGHVMRKRHAGSAWTSYTYQKGRALLQHSAPRISCLPVNLSLAFLLLIFSARGALYFRVPGPLMRNRDIAFTPW